MILEYHRPETLDQALELLSRDNPRTLPLGGGTVLNSPSSEEYDVVDLQLLKLNKISKKGNLLQLGATATLQSLYDNTHIPTALADAVHHEAAYNLRHMATIAGSLVSADGRSPLSAAFLALDAQLTILPENEKIGYGDLLPLRADRLPKRLITQISIPLQAKLAYHYVARSPADLPIVCVALAQWPSGRTRLSLGGFGYAPSLAFDGKGVDGLNPGVENAFSHAQDEWASAEYRLDAAKTLAQRCLKHIAA
ncbi:MAG: FAD binding domain-containing protein [Anaerolineae bacterium]|nr:FAD binding domain-containing protein [Anaerolineae bacterium]